MTVANARPLEAIRRMNAGQVPAVVEPLLQARGDDDELKAAIRTAVQGIGFECFVISRRNRLTRDIGSNWRCWGTHPGAWADLSRARNYAAIEPIRRSAYRAAVPLIWDQARVNSLLETREYFADAASFGICSGVSMAVSTSHRSYVDFFDVYTSARTITDAHRKEVMRRMTDLWALGAYGRLLLPEGVFGNPSRESFRAFSHRRARP
jgi:hypothetical protein